MMDNTARKLTHKTEAVMRLLTGSNIAVNPMLDNEFKQSVIEMHSGGKPEHADEDTAREQTIVMEPAPKAPEVTEINVTSELITEILPRVLERFKCCTCGKCFAESMTDALSAVDSVSVKVYNQLDLQRAEELKTKNRSAVMNSIVKIAIGRRMLPHHS